jgi:ubiquitin carboxyl-terminal hydrolase 14
MNSALQCLRVVPELRAGLNEYQGPIGGVDLEHDFAAALRDMFVQADNSMGAITPVQFVDVLRRSHPTFAQQGPRGGYMQQDSEELLLAVFNTLSKKLTTANKKDKPDALATLGGSSNLIDALFGLKMEETYTCAETDAEPPTTKQSKVFKLVCNIEGGAGKDVQINHLNEGVQMGLEGQVEKNSDVLGRNAIFNKISRVDTLPRVMCVQFMRFYWKATPDNADHAGVKCKMLRPVTFPMVMDTYEFCSDRLKGILKVQRDRRSQEILEELEKKQKAREAEEAAEAAAAGKDAEMADAAADGDTKMGDADEENALQAALAMSMSEAGGPVETCGPGIPEKFTGNYELFGVVTHKGRSSDGGHYMGFVREDGDQWMCFDDETVEECHTDDVKQLKGGGDHDMAYLCFYRYKVDE